jgi:hypothetical protein
VGIGGFWVWCVGYEKKMGEVCTAQEKMKGEERESNLKRVM